MYVYINYYYSFRLNVALNNTLERITWIDFLISTDPIGVNDSLDSLSKCVGSVEGWWSLLGLDAVQDWSHTGTTLLLKHTCKSSVCEKLGVCGLAKGNELIKGNSILND